MPVHGLGRPPDHAAVSSDQALMTEADAKQRTVAVSDDLSTYAEVGLPIGLPGAGRDDDVVKAERCQVRPAHLVVAQDEGFLAVHLPQQLEEVVGEGVVVVDQQGLHGERGEGSRGCHNAAVSAPRPDRQRGVFETLLVLGGEPVELDAHLTRLGASLAALFPNQIPPSGLADEIEAAAEGIARGGLRATVAPGAGDRLGVAVESVQIDPRRILPPAPSAVEARAMVVPGGLGGHKWADRALLDEMQTGSDADPVPLIFDWDGTLLEASRANAFAAFGRTLLTPPADGRILPGVTRARALQAAAETGFEVVETPLLREDLARADEVFLTGSLRGVERISALDGVELPGRGEAASLIHDTLRQTWAGAGLDRVPRR